ncbi:MAG: hypothetical protein AAFR52_04555 [Pseudomonadota bacterium]
MTEPTTLPDFLHEFLETAPFAVTLAGDLTEDRKRPLLAANERFWKLTGFPRQTAVGQDLSFMQSDTSQPRAVALFAERLAAYAPVEVVIRNCNVRGEVYDMLVSIMPLRDLPVPVFVAAHLGIDPMLGARAVTEHLAAVGEAFAALRDRQQAAGRALPPVEPFLAIDPARILRARLSTFSIPV